MCVYHVNGRKINKGKRKKKNERKKKFGLVHKNVDSILLEIK